jgi:predicted PurR-regulated permease PerM
VRRLALATSVTLATGLSALLLWRFRSVAAIFVASLAIASALRPLVDRLERRRINRSVALAIVYVSGLTLLGVAVYVAGHLVVAELEDGMELAGAAYERLRTSPPPGAPSRGLVIGLLVGHLPPSDAIYRAIGAARLDAVANQLLGATMNLIDGIGACLIVLALSAYWSASRESFERLWMSLVPGPRRTRAREVWRAVVAAVGAHVRSELGQSAAAVISLSFGFWLLRLPTPILPALLIGLVRLVPFVGVVVAIAAAFLAGAVVGAPLGLLAAAYTLGTLLVLDRGVARRMLRARRYSATLIVLLAIALVDAWGMVGLLVASPLAAAIQVAIEQMVVTRPSRTLRAETVAELEAGLVSVRQRLRLIQPRAAAELGSVLERLNRLVVEARAIEGARRRPSAVP